MQTLIAEDLLLLLLDDEKGTLAHSDKIQPVLGGALLVELALAERIEVAEKTSRWRAAKVVVIDGPTLDDPLLSEALAEVDEKPRSAQDLVTRLGKGAKEQLLRRLEERGMVHPVKGTVLGVFPRTTWPTGDRAHEDAVRALIQGPLVQGTSADARTSALISLLAAIGQAHKVVERGDVPAREIKARAKVIADGDWAAKAVKDAVAAAQAATAAAMVAISTGAAVGS